MISSGSDALRSRNGAAHMKEQAARLRQFGAAVGPIPIELAWRLQERLQRSVG